MPGIFASVQINNVLGLLLFFVLWIVLCEGAHVLVMLSRRDPLIGWAVGPFGVTAMFLHEPSLLYIWLNVLGPALVSGGVLYLGLFTFLSPITLPHHPFFEALTVTCGVILTSLGNLTQALRDLRYPLWGEARLLRSIQYLRARWARIHFTSFGYSYLRDHFGANPTDLLQAF